jgi:predicted amidophosphoribosyltransferase
MHCTSCSETWPGILNAGGLCPNCAAIAQNLGHRVGCCPLCTQQNVPIEVHHPGLKRHWPTVTVPVCLSCHRILTNRTVSEWKVTLTSSPVRCLIQGLTDLIWLWSVRSGSAGELLRVARLSAVALMHHFGFAPFRRLS